MENAQAINEGKMPVDKLGIKAVGKDEVVITLTKPNSYFKTLMTYPLFEPQSEEIVQKYMVLTLNIWFTQDHSR